MYTIHKGAYNAKHPKSFLISRPTGLYCYLFLIVKSPSLFIIGGKQFTVNTTSAVIISPNTPYQYSSIDCEYKNDWLYFDCSDEYFTSKYHSLFNHPITLNNSLQFSQLFQQLIWENHYALEPFHENNVDMIFQIIFNKLLQEEQTKQTPMHYNPYTLRLQKMRLDMMSQPSRNHTPTEQAAKLGISSSYFQFLYKELFGIPFKSDLIHMRLEYARNLISETVLPFEEIALMCGYSNEVHFYRQFKAKVGVTPGEYRASIFEAKK
jgi:AraC family transcriptional regulator of arabinose operon